MRLLSKAKDGGPESPVDGYFLFEIKSLFSIVLLHFNRGTRESLHNHAFNALTFWLRGGVLEETNTIVQTTPLKSERITNTFEWGAGQIKLTPRELLHRIITPATGVYRGVFGTSNRSAVNGAWALSFRGPWKKTWQEYKPATVETITLTHGRKLVTDQCPKCSGPVINTSHGPYCSKPTCKWGWEVEMDGSPLQPPKEIETDATK